MPDVDPDQPIWGAKEIARVAGLFGSDGEPDERKTFYLIEIGAIDATKIGHEKKGRLVSTRRRILRSLGIETAA